MTQQNVKIFQTLDSVLLFRFANNQINKTMIGFKIFQIKIKKKIGKKRSDFLSFGNLNCPKNLSNSCVVRNFLKS